MANNKSASNEPVLTTIARLCGGLLLLGALVFVMISTKNDLFETIVLIVILGSAIGLFVFGSYFTKYSIKMKEEHGENAVYRVQSMLDELTAKHTDALAVQYRKLAHTDAYGNVILDQWKKEIVYFRETVVAPALNADDYEVSMIHLWDRLNDDSQVHHFELHGDRCVREYFVTILDSLIDDFVQDYVANHTSEISVDMDGVSPSEFEQLCAERLKNAGWATQVSAGSGDQGVDIVARSGETTAVFQCKRYSKPLGNTPVQEIFTGKQFYKAQIAAVVTNADYTSGARAAAEQTGVYLLHYSELDSFSPSRFSEQ